MRPQLWWPSQGIEPGTFSANHELLYIELKSLSLELRMVSSVDQTQKGTRHTDQQDTKVTAFQEKK